MGNLLVENPDKYIINFLGVKNRSEIDIAVEIYLADKVFDPKFINPDALDEISRVDKKVEQLYRIANLTDVKPLHYFHYMDFAVNGGWIEKDTFEDYGAFVAHKILRSNKLTSKMAKLLIKSNDFYQKIHQEKIYGIKDNNNLKKVMGLITLQNKELYKLELQRLKSMREYHIFEKYQDDFEMAEKYIVREGLCYS